MTPNKDGYPTPTELRRFRSWRMKAIPPGTPLPDVVELVDHIKRIWWKSDLGFKLRKGFSHYPNPRGVVKLELHTGGWSGNEGIIAELEHTLFWTLYWVKSIRGGHYWFEIPQKQGKDWIPVNPPGQTP